ncbi:hypothetical protein Scep_017587 [Stephania cephalantha]|uniref:Uncharacterized protein n=1 Tax=Stephania cephalantha TaxID=152367 RepID=A0AAP0IPV3_9MAGN
MSTLEEVALMNMEITYGQVRQIIGPNITEIGAERYKSFKNSNPIKVELKAVRR